MSVFTIPCDDVVRIFSDFGVRLILEGEFDEQSAVVGPMRVLVFKTESPVRKMKLYLSASRGTFVISDEGKTRRAVYGFPIENGDPVRSLGLGVAKMEEMLESLRGGDIIERPVDWRDYK